MTKTILAIESSCDETAMSVVRVEEKSVGFEIEVISNVVASQIDLHKKYGGVYPEFASRAHLEAAIPVLEEALLPLQYQKLNTVPTVRQVKNQNDNLEFKNSLEIRNSKLEIPEGIDAIAVTTGPGLIGSLLMGTEATQILASYFNKPVVAVNHLEGHIYAAFSGAVKSEKLKVKSKSPAVILEPEAKRSDVGDLNHDSQFIIHNSNIFPILALVVSGGHTSLILMKNHLNYETVGQTIDDAAGEAFDKVARILELGYPGGPAIEKLAVEGNEDAYKLPLSMLNSKDLNFSFSGLKTAVLYLTKNPSTGEARPHNKADLASSFQKTVCEILTKKTISAIEKYNPKTVILSGGVSANGYLRDYFSSAISNLQTTNYRPPTVLAPPRELSTDNALGIAIIGALKFLKNQSADWSALEANPNWKIDDLSNI